MPGSIGGLHHVTAIAADPRRNLDFYSRILGLRLVKQTVNFDDPGAYHLYYGDEVGRPGTVLTFFAWPGAPRGKPGAGQATVVGLTIPRGAMGYWLERFATRGVACERPRTRFDEEVLGFRDPDGLRLELVAWGEADGVRPWREGPVPEDVALRGFHSVTLTERDPALTAGLLTEIMGFRPAAAEAADRSRFVAANGGLACRVDLLAAPRGEPGRIAVGTVHHVAWRVGSDADQLAWREALVRSQLSVTGVIDRRYFRSIYFPEPGGVLFEIATIPPGFTVDEGVAELGSALRLPPWLEARRRRIEAELPGLSLPRA